VNLYEYANDDPLEREGLSSSSGYSTMQGSPLQATGVLAANINISTLIGCECQCTDPKMKETQRGYFLGLPPGWVSAQNCTIGCSTMLPSPGWTCTWTGNFVDANGDIVPSPLQPKNPIAPHPIRHPENVPNPPPGGWTFENIALYYIACQLLNTNSDYCGSCCAHASAKHLEICLGLTGWKYGACMLAYNGALQMCTGTCIGMPPKPTNTTSLVPTNGCVR
jgi:hypothetical protein